MPSAKRLTVSYPAPILLVIAAASVLIAGGCKEDKPEFEIIALENARIENIDLKSDRTGTIKVSFYNEKYDKEVVDEGVITAETEILVDGAVASLKDLRVGERIQGQVRIDKVDGKRRQTALKITVNRPKPVG